MNFDHFNVGNMMLILLEDFERLRVARDALDLNNPDHVRATTNLNDAARELADVFRVVVWKAIEKGKP